MNRNKALKLAVEAHPYCPHCGATDGLQTHHRRNRGMGSSKLLDRFDNFLRVCAALNYAMESDSAVASEARDMGWKLSQWDSFDHPYFDKVSASWWILTEDGRKLPADPPQYLI